MTPHDDSAARLDRVNPLTLPPTLPPAVGPLLVAASFVAMLAWTWFKWPDPLTDFGRELYLAWQVSGGKVLYRDVEHFNGPLSVYFNALLFKVFGPAVQTLAYANIAIAAAIVALLYSLIRQYAGAIAATACGVTFTTLFACVQFVDTGNYNFITPYSHEVTHGMLLALAAMWCCTKSIETRKLVLTAATGALLGLLWLTKLEIFLAAAVAVGVGILLPTSVAQTFVSVSPIQRHPTETATRKPVQQILLTYVCLMLSMLAVLVTAFVLLRVNLPAGDALRGVLGSAYYVSNSQLTSLPFYRRIAGFDNIGANAGTMLVSAAAIALLLGFRWFEQLRRSRQRTAKPPYVLLTALPLLVAWLAPPGFPWHLALRGLPLVVAGMLIQRFLTTRRHRQPADLTAMMFFTFSLVLLAKVVLAAQVSHYGFALAMPATLAVVAMLTTAPARSNRKAFNVFGVSTVVTFIAVHLSIYARLFSDKPIVVGSAGNTFFASAGAAGQPSRGESLAALLDNFESIVPKDATLAAVPEGAMINFLTRRPNPTPFITLQPPEYLMFGADRITQAYMNSSPEFFVINLSVDPAEYGSRGFDVDYGKSLADWLKQNYSEQARFGRLILLVRR